MAFSTDKSESMVPVSKSHVQTEEHVCLCPPSLGIQTTQKILGKARLRKRFFRVQPLVATPSATGRERASTPSQIPALGLINFREEIIHAESQASPRSS